MEDEPRDASETARDPALVKGQEPDASGAGNPRSLCRPANELQEAESGREGSRHPHWRLWLP